MTKKIIVVVAAALTFGFASSPGAHAQLVPSGSVLIGGSGSMFIGESHVSVSARPGFAYAVLDNVVGGAILSSSISTLGVRTSSNFSVGPFARFYLNNGIFGHGELTLRSGSSFSGLSLQLGMGAGFAYFLTPSVAIEPIGRLFIDNGISLGGGIGLQVYLNRGK